MAAKNRKRNNAGFAFPLPTAIFLSLIVSLLLMYAWLDAHTHALGTRIKVLKQRRTELEHAYAHELAKWEQLKSPANIERALARNRLVMIAPEPSAVVRIAKTTTRDEVGLIARLETISRIRMND